MRGDDEQQAQRVPADHPLRSMRAMVDEVLRELSPQFSRLYATVGRPSIAPERRLRALLLQGLYRVRSERLLMEQLDYNRLFRWFVGLSADDPIWDATVFTKNRQRLLEGDIARAFFDRVVARARQRALLSDEHFTVDGTLIEAWASLKSFKPTGTPPPPPPDDPGNPTVNFHGERRQQRHPCLHHRPRRPAVSQGRRPRGQALLPGARAEGEPPGAGRRRQLDAGDGLRRARAGPRHGHPAAGARPAGRGQEL
jgi:transposase